MEDLFKNENVSLVLSKDSNNEQVKNYFTIIQRIWEAGERFPVNLDDVWQMVYARKDNAVRSLTNDFIECVDYHPLLRNAERVNGGQNEVTYMLSLSCFEFFIARKVRAIFDVYSEFFHKTVDMVQRGELAHVQQQVPQTFAQALMLAAKQQEKIEEQQKLLASQQPKAEYYDNVLQASDTYTFEQMSKELNYRSVHKFTDALILGGVVYRQSGQLMLHAEHAGIGLTKTSTYTFLDNNGTRHNRNYTVWTEEGRQYLHYLRDKHKI